MCMAQQRKPKTKLNAHKSNITGTIVHIKRQVLSLYRKQIAGHDN